ncbi:hypothetical protein ONS95_012169 [Cadophora gregata]|uniref:uncharacterized protein n=1 Tax=Cadophora gregata TaxID=51156 RepID=UPI0026DCB3F6|nr:uncharacterized protein ONS95_012169 [Cadophora gregata]KAK0117848.1 hypothetical protein ONS95_012169 [Cadophora gregata]KAK0122902.1 hypothetical protein ONS96_009927 [Cadophora gregata f. sp. sojae]
MTTNLTTSLAITTLTSPTKRKATTFDFDDCADNSENIDPIIFLSPKRSKHPDGSHSKDALCKPTPTNFFLTRAPGSPKDVSSIKPTSTAASRPMLSARSPAKPRLDTTRSTPLSAPAGRSPTRKRIGILNRRKTGSPFTRVDPPRFSTSSSSSTSTSGFSIDAALSGTIASYNAPAPKVQPQAQALPIPALHQDAPKDSWFFEIHEDTEEELATNLMEHGACTLDISSDEESAARERDARGKENVPPMDDVSQTRTALSGSSSSGMTGELDAEAEMRDIKARLHRASRRQRQQADENAIEVDRSPLGDLVAEDFYGEGVVAGEVVVVADECEQEQEQERSREQSVGVVGVAQTFNFTAEVVGKGKGVEVEVGVGLCVETSVCEGVVGGKARLLEPIEKVEEGWSVWESGSAKGDE